MRGTTTQTTAHNFWLHIEVQSFHETIPYFKSIAAIFFYSYDPFIVKIHGIRRASTSEQLDVLIKFSLEAARLIIELPCSLHIKRHREDLLIMLQFKVLHFWPFYYIIVKLDVWTKWCYDKIGPHVFEILPYLNCLQIHSTYVLF